MPDGRRRQAPPGAPWGAGRRAATGGRLEVLCGPMFSGKTSELLRRVLAEEARGREVVLVKSAKDTRYAVDRVVSRGFRPSDRPLTARSC